MHTDKPRVQTDRQNSGCMSIVVGRLHLQNNGMRGNRSAGRGRMSRATSMYRMSLVNRSWFSNVTPWDSSRAVGMEEASLGMSEMSKVGTHDRASGLSGVSCTIKSVIMPCCTCSQYQRINTSVYVAVWVMSWRVRQRCAATDKFRAAYDQSLQHIIQHALG